MSEGLKVNRTVKKNSEGLPKLVSLQVPVRVIANQPTAEPSSL
jgi:hypothetical protein